MKVEKAKEGRDDDDDEKYVHVLVLFIGRTLGVGCALDEGALNT